MVRHVGFLFLLFGVNIFLCVCFCVDPTCVCSVFLVANEEREENK
jgi:hypothetical protein